MMEQSGCALFVFMAVTVTVTAFSVSNANSCPVCNCQVNNVEVLEQVVRAQVHRVLANEPCKLYILLILMDD